jgi:hypothetical protein
MTAAAHTLEFEMAHARFDYDNGWLFIWLQGVDSEGAPTWHCVGKINLERLPQ